MPDQDLYNNKELLNAKRLFKVQYMQFRKDNIKFKTQKLAMASVILNPKSWNSKGPSLFII